MTWLQALFLGVLQGLTEFLPISSSGHLVLFQSLFGLQDKNELFFFDIAVHFGTLLAVVSFYFRDLLNMAAQGLAWIGHRSDRSSDYSEGRLLLMVVVATLPAVVVGLGFKDQIEELFTSPKVAGFGLLFTGLILWLTRRCQVSSGQGKAPTFFSAFLVGCAQAVAITPGISRSGSTIAAGIFRRFDPPFAARFSFLMSIPAILGAVVLTLLDLETVPVEIGPVIIGTVASAVTGFLAIKWLLSIISKGKLHFFAYYCCAAGVVALVLV